MYSSLQVSAEEIQNENFFDMKKDINDNQRPTPSGKNVFSDIMANSNSGNTGKSYNAQINLVKRRIKIINNSDL